MKLKKFITTDAEHKQLLGFARQYNEFIKYFEAPDKAEFQAALLSQLVLREIRKGQFNPNLFQKIMEGMIEPAEPEPKPENQ